jgi:hypothetical protein
MLTHNWGRIGLSALVVLAFGLGRYDPVDPFDSGTLAGICSGIAWALSTTFESVQLTGGTNLAAALFAALATGFFDQVASLAT